MEQDRTRPEGIGPGYQYDTKYYRDRRPPPCAWAGPTPPFKRYADPVARVALPRPVTTGGAGLWETITARRSQRVYAAESLSLADLSQLLWAIQGITGERDGFRFRAAGSAGALYPNETYLVINDVAGVTPGIAHYDVRDHALALIRAGGMGRLCAEACLGQSFCATAPVVFAWGAVVQRSAQKYGDRCYRYLYLDAGHLGGQLQLAAVALGLGSVNVGAFLDDEVNSLFGLDGVAETILYLTAVGKTDGNDR
ncbi:MAG: SagB/ThcOx family dehydrogenase [Acidobacteria bacterium]|nr:SagB/ThcOx family dehydrogenase [Acidobacteriota bacterium]